MISFVALLRYTASTLSVFNSSMPKRVLFFRNRYILARLSGDGHPLRSINDSNSTKSLSSRFYRIISRLDPTFSSTGALISVASEAQPALQS